MKETQTTTIYRCDQCETILSDDKRTHKRHLSLAFSGHCGFVEPGLSGQWVHVTLVETGIKQFCNTACLGAFMEAGRAV